MTEVPPRPSPERAADALARLEGAARRELVKLARDQPQPEAPTDPLLAHLAWDLGLTGAHAPRD